MISSRNIILDNIHILQIQEGINSYSALSACSGINENTIKSWFSSKDVYPRLSTLDIFCNAFQMYTYELFIPTSPFQHNSSKPNNSRDCFIYNFKSLCLDKKILSFGEMSHLCCGYISSDTLKSYLRQKNGRTIPIYNIDVIAELFNIKPYQLLLPKEVFYATQ